MEQLRSENRELRDQCSDLQAQLLHNSVECGRSLLADGGQPSLAAELNGVGMDHQRVREPDLGMAGKWTCSDAEHHQGAGH